MDQHHIHIQEAIGGLYDAYRRWNTSLKVGEGVLFDALTAKAIDSDESLAQQLSNAMGDFDIPPSSTSGDVNRYPGLFTVNDEALAATEQLNAAKSHLEEAVGEARAAGVSRQRLRRIYASAGAGRLHPKQAWRQITILEPDELESVGFTIAKFMTSIELMDAAEAMEMLAHHEAYEVMKFIREAGVDKVRLRMPLAPHVRANIVWGKGKTRRSQMVYASLPFLLPMGSWPAKRVRFNEPRNHAKRSDARFDADSMPLHFIYGGSISLVREAA